MKVRVIKRPPAAWMRGLFVVNIASLVLALGTWLPIGKLSFGLNLLVILGSIVCLKNLGQKNRNYENAVIPLVLNLVMLFVNRLIPSVWVSMAMTVLFAVAALQEYSAHSQVAAAHNGGLARSWQSLLGGKILVAALTIAACILAMLGLGGLISIISTVTGVLRVVLGVLYLLYLSRTIQLV